MKNIITLVILIISLSAHAQSVESTLKYVVEHLNKDMPKEIDALTTIIHSKTYKNSLTFTYKMPSTDVSSLDLSTLQYFKIYVMKKNVDYYCTSPSQQMFLDMDVTIAFVYLDKNDELISNITIPASVCK